MRKIIHSVVAFALAIVMLALALTSCVQQTTTPRPLKVTFMSDGNMLFAQDVVKGSTIVEPEAPVKPGYTFDGWYLGDYKWDFTYKLNTDMSLSARWVGDGQGSQGSQDSQVSSSTEDITSEDGEHRIIFDTRGGTNVLTQFVADGGVISKPTDPTKQGYIFKGWYVGDLEWNFATPVTGEITLVAKWSKDGEITITFKTGVGTSVPAQTIQKGQKVPKPADPIRSGYDFNGWYCETFDIVWDFNTIAQQDITLVAQWIKKANTDDGEFCEENLTNGTHIWTEYQQIFPTCTENGTETLKCIYCNKRKTTEVKSLGHQWVSTSSQRVLYKTQECSRSGCSEVRSEELENIASDCYISVTTGSYVDSYEWEDILTDGEWTLCDYLLTGDYLEIEITLPMAMAIMQIAISAEIDAESYAAVSNSIAVYFMYEGESDYRSLPLATATLTNRTGTKTSAAIVDRSGDTKSVKKIKLVRTGYDYFENWYEIAIGVLQ